MWLVFLCRFFFFFNDTATTEIYTLSLHDALPISSKRAARRKRARRSHACDHRRGRPKARGNGPNRCQDRKSTRLNSSHSQISYAVFCLKKKKTHINSCHIPRDILITRSVVPAERW